MSDQPMPKLTEKGELVTPTAISEFLSMISKRTQKGMETYGQMLHTHNGRDAVRDAKEELIDAWQYITQIEMERRDLLEQLRVTVDVDTRAFEQSLDRACESISAILRDRLPEEIAVWMFVDEHIAPILRKEFGKDA